MFSLSPPHTHITRLSHRGRSSSLTLRAMAANGASLRRCLSYNPKKPKKSKCPKPTPTSSSPAYSTIRSADAAWEKHASIPVASSVPPASHVGGPGVEASDTGAQGRVHGCALRLLWGRAGSGGAHSLPLRLSPPPAPLVYASRQMSKRHLTATSSRSPPPPDLSPSHLVPPSYPQTSPCPWSCLALPRPCSCPAAPASLLTREVSNKKQKETTQPTFKTAKTRKLRSHPAFITPSHPPLSPLHVPSPSASKGSGLSTASTLFTSSPRPSPNTCPPPMRHRARQP